MDKHYDHKQIEKKWQSAWQDSKVFEVTEDKDRPKYYTLCMFPYPSSQGLHVGHPESYTAVDIVARYMRLKGFNVLNPIGWDAFGLPAENYAIKQGVPPWETTQKSIDNFRRQIKSFGFSYDWSREVNTSDPSYYKWTQWMFLQMYKHGLAYRAKAKVNWCGSCQTVLANEQVVDGKCERCKNEVMQKDLEQWFFRVTKYAEELLQDLDKIDWPEPIKAAQRNWIGKSEGAELEFKVKDTDFAIKVFTTRPDTLYGATYMVLAPEHPLVEKLRSQIKNWDEVENYRQQAQKKSELQRTDLNKEKTGVELKGIKAINPATSEEIPVFIADYVLMSYGTGAIMAVPAHDQRDFEFAKKYGLPVRQVVRPENRNCIIVHGSNPTREIAEQDPPENLRHWKPWLQAQLESIGIKVANELYPEDWKPDYDKWKKVFEKNDINENSILVGHSAGTAFILRWLSENKKKVDKVILVAPSIIKSKKYQNISKLKDFVFDSSLREYFNKLVIFYSDDDSENFIKSAERIHSILGGKLIELKGRGHFTIEDNPNNKEFPELLEEILRVDSCYEGQGIMINSAEFNRLSNEEAKWKITEKVGGKKKVQYRLRDWLISRQRFWGAPIPIVYCRNCASDSDQVIEKDGQKYAVVEVPENDLPVLLPRDVDFKPTGESPLARSQEFHQVKCPRCGAEGEGVRREVDTMDTFVCSSWYFLRYTDPHNDQAPFAQDKVEYWLPVDLYIGGAEHAVLHLLYSRFFVKALRDMGYLKFDEPFLKLRNQGMILGEDGQKMSKSRGNVINPDEVVEEYGADTMRLYEMFMGPLEDTKPWSTKGIVGVRRFLEKIWLVVAEWLEQGKPDKTSAELERLFHRTYKKVTEDIEAMKFNTAISAMMILVNQMAKEKSFKQDLLEKFLIVLSPFAPHLAEEIWRSLGNDSLIALTSWPEWNEELIKQEEIEIPVQVNGKVRAKIKVPADTADDEVIKLALDADNVKKHIAGKEVVKQIYVPGKIVNIVVR